VLVFLAFLSVNKTILGKHRYVATTGIFEEKPNAIFGEFN